MRPLILSMSAFGPFAGDERIDFTQLGDNPLFLINGPTGSGKTTILDAICFALYGRTTGDERDGAQMRCDLADAEQLTEVSLEFALAGRSYRIRRIPEQLRPKSRGDGFTSQSPEAQLYQLHADGSESLLVSSKVTEATKAIEELTGLSVDQFRQVMILPQGKFRQLLLAESAEREKIFSQLFQTHIYKRLEESLKAQSAEIRREREGLLQLQQGILEGADLESVEECLQQLQTVAEQLEQAAKLKAEKEKRLTECGNVLQQGLAIRDDFQRLGKIKVEAQQLDAQKDQIDQHKSSLQQAEAAAKLQPLFNDQQRCQEDLQQADKAFADAVATRQASIKQLEAAERQLADSQCLRKDLESGKQQLTQLAAYRSRVEQLLQARTNAAATARQVRVAGLYLDYKQLLEQVDQQRELARLEQGCAQQEQLLIEKKAQGTRLGERYAELEQQAKKLELTWHQGQAAILAAELTAGEPCPVCGSTEHPVPAKSDVSLPTQQQVERARSEAAIAQEELLAAREQYAGEQSRLRDLRADLTRLQEQTGGAIKSPAELAAERLDLESAAKESAVDLPSAQHLQGFDVSRLQQDLELAQRAALTAKTQTEIAQRELPAEYREAGALELAEQQLSQQVEQLEQQLAALAEQHQLALGQVQANKAAAEAAEKQRQRASDMLEKALAIALTALQGSCFVTEQDYQAALLEELAQRRLRAAVSDFEAALQRLDGARQQLEDSLRGKESPDLEILERQFKAAEEEKTSATSAWQQLDKRYSLLSGTQEKLRRARQTQEDLEQRYAVVGTLSDVANGQTGNKISLQRFVLSVLLDDVLIEASQRLSLMSKGRYQLLRKEDRSKGNKASGLELEVEDAYTGKQRAVATLSGGESFMAALSLALGLSDVVQAYAGGIRLDTLFVDEGFGSLDPESLDLAVRALVDLQATGRMVGVISHVAELKEQLPLRIDVVSDRLGSKTRLVKG